MSTVTILTTTITSLRSGGLSYAWAAQCDSMRRLSVEYVETNGDRQQHQAEWDQPKPKLHGCRKAVVEKKLIFKVRHWVWVGAKCNLWDVDQGHMVLQCITWFLSLPMIYIYIYIHTQHVQMLVLYLDMAEVRCSIKQLHCRYLYLRDWAQVCLGSLLAKCHNSLFHKYTNVRK